MLNGIGNWQESVDGVGMVVGDVVPAVGRTSTSISSMFYAECWRMKICSAHVFFFICCSFSHLPSLLSHTHTRTLSRSGSRPGAFFQCSALNILLFCSDFYLNWRWSRGWCDFVVIVYSQQQQHWQVCCVGSFFLHLFHGFEKVIPVSHGILNDWGKSWEKKKKKHYGHVDDN